MREKDILDENLYGEFNWFYQSFAPAFQTASDEFFSQLFTLKLISVSKNINILFQGNDYFVTKIRIDKQHDVFLRGSTDAVQIILDKILGKNKKFNIAEITELEAKIISSFNDYLYESISKYLIPPPTPNKKRKNFDTIHLTFFIKSNESEDCGKIILSIPEVLLSPEIISPNPEAYDVSGFNKSLIDVNIKIGTTKFLLKDLKQLDVGDLVVFENSDIHTMTLIYKDYTTDFKITPNPAIISGLDDNNEGENNMEENSLSQSLWDEIQIEMGAEFDKVKISLGELKTIEQGLVVDISSVYNNKISLKVEDKIIARGELVIVNDRYGVRVEEVFANEKTEAEEASANPENSEELPVAENDGEVVDGEVPPEGGDEDFDYSDFNLDEQDI